MFRWWRERKRRKILSHPFPQSWEEILTRHVHHLAALSEDEQQRLQNFIQIFAAEKSWEGCNGQPITDEVRVTIAAFACLLVVNRSLDAYHRLHSILVYPDEYFVQNKHPNRAGVVTEAPELRLGEAMSGGPVVLSWASVLAAANQYSPGHNVVIHEFAHVLDAADHAFDGTPVLDTKEQYQTWRQVMSREFQNLVEDAVRGEWSLLDHYGTTNEAEFFAVATECFFELPDAMAAEHPQLYQVLSDFYRQDPANIVRQ